MNLLKKISVGAMALAFGLVLFTTTTNAQGRHGGWSNRPVYIQYGNPVWNRRASRVTPQEYRRLQRERYRLYRSSNRYYNDGYLSEKERRKLARKYSKYRRDVYRDRHDW